MAFYPIAELSLFEKSGVKAVSVENDMRLLSNFDLLKCLVPDEIKLLAFTLQKRHLLAGDVLFKKGDPASGPVILVSGRLRVLSGKGETDEKEISGSTILETPGTVLGERALFMGVMRPATVIALSDVESLELPRHVFLRLLEEYPEKVGWLRNIYANRLSTLIEEIRKSISSSVAFS
ncbi:MAG: cyclic nucleotide-binding domain-containing protein [Alphaproteobacteria bacterium]|nr:cyclic nucleotide-binding domain-containing protein [Alphaproteobacteria bacterium]